MKHATVHRQTRNGISCRAIGDWSPLQIGITLALYAPGQGWYAVPGESNAMEMRADYMEIKLALADEPPPIERVTKVYFQWLGDDHQALFDTQPIFRSPPCAA